MSMEDIKTYTDSMWKEAKQIKYNAQKIAWYMRGGVDFVDILNMSGDEIDHLNAIIEDNMETTKKTKMPFF
jgi:hypothetical protein